MKESSKENLPRQPGNALEASQALCAEQGKFAAVDEEYYRAFLNLTPTQVESIAIALLLDNETTVRRLAVAHADPVARVARFLVNGFATLSTGILQFDAFGRPRCCAPIGPEPSEAMNAAIDARLEEIQPMVLGTVRHMLPWLESRSGRAVPSR
jgi:hypothetical protein